MREFEVVFTARVEVENLGDLHEWMNEVSDVIDESGDSDFSWVELFDDGEDDDDEDSLEDEDGIEMDDNSL